jgi:gas vesicle protein
MKLVLGFAIGVALGLVFAPASGEKTRAQLKNKARDLSRYPARKAQEKVRKAAAETEQRAGEIGSRVGREVAQAAVKAVTREVVNNNEPGQRT